MPQNIIDREISTPIYQQLKLIIQDRIVLGDWISGMLLPTEEELCEIYKVSRTTVRTALNEIARNGLVERIQGKGTIVSTSQRRGEKLRRLGFSDLCRSQNLPVRSVLISQKMIESNEELHSCLGLAGKSPSPMWRFERLRYITDEPAVITTTVVRKEIGDKMLDYDLSNLSFYKIYEDITGRSVVTNDGVIKAVSVNSSDAELLGVEEGSAHLWFRGIAYLEGNVPIEVNYSIFHGEKFSFQKPEYYSIDRTPVPKLVLERDENSK
jgi:GntR family transcriptional regulator